MSQCLHIDTIFYTKIVSWIGVSYASGVGRGIATTFVLARLLPSEAFGAFRYVIAVYGVASIFSFSSYHTGIIRGIAAQDTEVAWAGAKRMVALSFIGIPIIFLAAAERFWYQEPSVGWAILLSGLAFPFTSASSLYGSILTGKGDIPTLSRYNAFSNIIFIVIFSLTLILSQQNLVAISLAFFGGDVLIKGALSLYQLARLPRQGSATRHGELGLHLSFMGIFQAFAHQADQIIIQRFFGYTSLANYSITTLIPEQINDFAKSFGGILLARKTQQANTKSILTTTRKQFVFLFFFACFICLGYALSAKYVLELFFPRYADTYWASIVYSLGLLSFPSVLGVVWQQNQNQLKRLWIFSLVNGSVQLVGSFVFAYFFQSFGLILAKVTSRLISTLFTYPTDGTKNSQGGTSTKAA